MSGINKFQRVYMHVATLMAIYQPLSPRKLPKMQNLSKIQTTWHDALLVTEAGGKHLDHLRDVEKNVLSNGPL